MRTVTDFSGLWIPLVTPFHHGAVDHAALAALVKRLAKQGVAGFVACGSTGEAAALSDPEQLAVLDTVLAAAETASTNSDSRLPVMMGLSGYRLEDMLARVAELQRYPLAALLVPAPHYIRPSQAGLLHWFRTIADAASAPLCLYDIPYRTGVAMALETLLALAAHPNIAAIKDCGGDATKTWSLITDGRLQVLAGEDAQTFGSVAQGAVGAIAASAHLQADRFAQVIDCLRQGRLHEARAAWRGLPEHIGCMFAEPNPASIKAALAAQGLMHNELRAPMMAATTPVAPASLGSGANRP